MLLTADLHLTDSSQDEYRWQVFEAIERELRQSRDDQCYILGDLTDRRDRHSSALVNRLLDQLNRLTEYADVTIIAGNHDAPLSGPPYWQFLSALKGIRYISKPTADGERLLLPASQAPNADWQGIPFGQYEVAFMHQTVVGATLAHGVYADCEPFLFPRHLKVYSGDLHIPHTIRNVTYIGAPHHVKFGDDHECRLLMLDDDYEIENSIILHPPSKRIVEINNVDDLQRVVVHRNDQLRVLVKLDPRKLEQWPEDREVIQGWASRIGVSITSLEGIVDQKQYITRKGKEDRLTMEPRAILDAFADAEDLDDDLYDSAVRLLNARG